MEAPKRDIITIRQVEAQNFLLGIVKLLNRFIMRPSLIPVTTLSCFDGKNKSKLFTKKINTAFSEHHPGINLEVPAYMIRSMYEMVENYDDNEHLHIQLSIGERDEYFEKMNEFIKQIDNGKRKISI